MTERDDFQVKEIPSTPASGPENPSKFGSRSLQLGVLAIIILLLAISLPAAETVKFNWEIRYSILENQRTIGLLSTFLLCLSPLVGLIGLVLGIVALARKNDQRGLGVIGLAINGVVFVAPPCYFLFLLLTSRLPQ
jgi:hypothetical protein